MLLSPAAVSMHELYNSIILPKYLIEQLISKSNYAAKNTKLFHYLKDHTMQSYPETYNISVKSACKAPSKSLISSIENC